MKVGDTVGRAWYSVHTYEGGSDRVRILGPQCAAKSGRAYRCACLYCRRPAHRAPFDPQENISRDTNHDRRARRYQREGRGRSRHRHTGTHALPAHPRRTFGGQACACGKTACRFLERCRRVGRACGKNEIDPHGRPHLPLRGSGGSYQKNRRFRRDREGAEFQFYAFQSGVISK